MVIMQVLLMERKRNKKQIIRKFEDMLNNFTKPKTLYKFTTE